jgi:hypothetical protein
MMSGCERSVSAEFGAHPEFAFSVLFDEHRQITELFHAPQRGDPRGVLGLVLDTDGAEFTGRCADVALAYVTHDQRLELVDG